MILSYRYFVFICILYLVLPINIAKGISVIEVQASSLDKEYSENYIRAKEKYQEYEYFLISGDIDSIESGWSETYSRILLNTNRTFYTLEVQVNINKYNNFIVGLNKNDVISLLCPIQLASYRHRLTLNDCEPDTKYRIYLRQEVERQQEEVARQKQVAESKQQELSQLKLEQNEDSSKIQKIAITVAPSQMNTNIIVVASKVENVVKGETSLGEQAKYYVRYKGNVEDIMAIETVEIILPHPITEQDNYQIYSEQDKKFLINQNLQKIEKLLNEKNITGAIAGIDPYQAKLFSEQLNSNNVLFLNNFAYYLEQNGLYVESAIILEEVTKRFPQRVVARINLGDAYWGINAYYQNKALEHYQVYVSLMEKNGRRNKVPQRIYDRMRY